MVTPFQIQWTFLRLPPWPDDVIRSVKRLYFEDAGKRWAYAVQGWPARTDGAPLQLPGDRPFTSVEIQVNFEYFQPHVKDAVARVAAIQRLKPSQAQPWNFPYLASLNIDLDDLDRLLQDRARFLGTILHEIGHVLGIGTLWQDDVPQPPVLAKDPQGNDVYVGKYACKAYAGLRKLAPGAAPAIALDVEKVGTTKAFHWSEDDLRYEIMSTDLDHSVVGAGNAISAISVGALKDLGYLVNMDAAEPLPAASAAPPASPATPPSPSA